MTDDASSTAQPRLVKTIVFGYTLDYFPGPLIVGYNQLKRKLQRAGFAVSVRLCPLSDLPSDVSIIFTPLELADQAAQAAPHSRIIALESFLNQPSYNALVEQLKEGREWTAARVSTHARSDDEGQIVNYRGYERIE